MAFRFTVGRKIGVGFATLIFLTFIAFGLTLITLNKSKQINDQITNQYTPSVNVLQDLYILVVKSKMYIINWVSIQKDAEEKELLKTLVGEEYPVLKKKIYRLAKEWKEDKESIAVILSLMDHLIVNYKYIMGELPNFVSYEELKSEDPFKWLEINNMIEDGGKISAKTRIILNKLDALIAHQVEMSEDINEKMLDSFAVLQNFVVALGMALLAGGIIIALLTVRTIVRPVNEVKSLLLRMSRGVLPDQKIRGGFDEIGEMSRALNRLVGTMKLTTEFAREVGGGNFDSYYKPLSDEDALGQALLKMRKDLHVNERMLEDKVTQRTAEVMRQKGEMEVQSQKIEVLYKQVTDSIRYAKRIQEAILPPDRVVKKLLPDSFVLYKPKDIVSGDFYWLYQLNGKVLFSVVDCTGHGVPGAFMSIVGYNLLRQIIGKSQSARPAEILDELSKNVSETLHQRSYEESSSKDGMDVSMCVFDPGTYDLEFAGAFNPMFLVRGGEMFEIKGNKFPIGVFLEKEAKKFTNHKIKMQKGDVVYIFSDGYADQFGGANGKKFMQRQFRNLLLDIHHKPMPEQKKILNQTVESWRGNEDQVDDILVMGMRVN